MLGEVAGEGEDVSSLGLGEDSDWMGSRRSRGIGYVNLLEREVRERGESLVNVGRREEGRIASKNKGRKWEKVRIRTVEVREIRMDKGDGW